MDFAKSAMHQHILLYLRYGQEGLAARLETCTFYFIMVDKKENQFLISMYGTPSTLNYFTDLGKRRKNVNWIALVYLLRC
jgi:hypothetical protein